MALRDFLLPTLIERRRKPEALTIDDHQNLKKALRIASVAIGFNGLPNTVSRKSTFEEPEYDLHRIANAIETDSYVMQAFEKHSELFWKEGWDLVGENPEAVDYLWQRIDYMELSLGKPFQEFLTEVVDQLTKFGNVFIVKARDKKGVLDQYFPDRLYTPQGKNPILGYYIIPTEQVEILRNKNNQPLWYQQNTTNQLDLFQNEGNNLPTWNAKNVIHLYTNRRQGHAFGTPFCAPAIDDVTGLRQMEEDIMNLVHRELFPLYKYQIGTEDIYPQQEDIDRAAADLEGLRTEGGIIIPNYHDIEIIGAEGNVLEASDYLNHFKERVAQGLGLFPHHLGMSNGGGNRAMTDRLDVSLYEKIKKRQAYFSEAIRFHIFNELLTEGGFDPLHNPSKSGPSDRCIMKFKEIDVDTQVKKEANIIQKVAAGIETIPEARLEMGLDPDMDESETVTAQNVRLQPTTQVIPGQKTATGGQSAPQVIDTTPPAAIPQSTPGMPNKAKNGGKGAGNMIRPTNQFGSRTSPNIRRWDDDTLNMIVEAIGDDDIMSESVEGEQHDIQDS